jgi:hypothetical protein
MEAKLENKTWWAIYNEAGVHPDECEIDFASPETVEASLKAEGIDFTAPRSNKPDQRYKEWIVDVVNASCYVDKELILMRILHDKNVQKMWEQCEPSDSPQLDEVIHEALGRPEFQLA